MVDQPLADLLPLWRTLREQDTTVLVTPAMDYVGCVELGGLDLRYAPEEVVAGAGEALRSLVGNLDDALNLQFLYRVYDSDEGAIGRYEAATRDAPTPALAEYVKSRAAWLRTQPVRRTRLFLFFTQPRSARGASERGRLGVRLMFKSPAALAQEEHEDRVKALASLRDKLRLKLGQAGLPMRELSVAEVRQLHYELLNPTSARRVPLAPEVFLRDNLWSEQFLAASGAHHAEYTEGEQLAFEALEDGRGHFRQGDVLRRVVTLKTLPEHGTDYFMGRALQRLALPGKDGEGAPLSYTLAVNIDVLPQEFTRWRLDTSHRLVGALKKAIPFLSDDSISKNVEDAAKQSSIASLFTELTDMATKVVTVGASLLLEAPTLAQLDEQTALAESAFAAAGNSRIYVEDVSQVPAFLSMLPGAGLYQLRKKGCTSRNAADFLPVAKSWPGGEVHSLLSTPEHEFFRFALFDKSFGVNAHHGLVAADTGSGKSFSLGLLILDALAAGLDAILVDNGNSWKHLTELMGGVHLPVDLNTSISPFMPPSMMVDPRTGDIDNELVGQAVRFIEICVTDEAFRGFDNPATDLVARAVKHTYRDRLRHAPDQRPLLGDFRAALRAAGEANELDGRVAAELLHRLRMFSDEDGLYARFLNRPSALRFDSRLLTFEMEKVSRDPLTKKIALAAIMEAISARAASRRNRTLVVVDEAHEYLGSDPAAEKFLGGCYAKMRKYDVAMWTLSQKFETFQASRVAPVIIGNSALKLFLWHSAGHANIGQYFRLPPRAVAQFAGLQKRPGRYSDGFLMYGTQMATVRLAPHPLAYWILTTDGDDKRAIERAAEKNPHLSRFQVLQALAERYPHGWSRAAPNLGRAA